MRADYDSEADAILIEIEVVDHWDRGVRIDDYCEVAFSKDRAVGVTLRYPREEMHLLDKAAGRYQLDGPALKACTQAALNFPDREITIEIGPRRLAGAAA